MTPRPVPAAVAVEDRLFRALAVLRVVVTLNAVGVNLWRRDQFEHPRAAVLAVAVLVAWTALALTRYAVARRRGTGLLVADLAVTVALIWCTPLLKGPDWNSTVPGYWAMGALLAWAVHWRWRGGLAAGLMLAAADLVWRRAVDENTYGNDFLLVVGGPVVGFLCGQLQLMAAERERALRESAAASERARLARAVHDGVLQVLALVQRGGGPGDELGRLAGEQEQALRALIAHQDRVVAESGPEPAADLAGLLAALEATPGVEVSVPATAVPLPPEVARELAAAARAAADNAVRHGGGLAWLLLEDLGDRVVVTVRDNGPGIAPGRLEEARQQGRLGVSGSVRGRLDDLGGAARLETGPSGTTWELEVAR